MNLHDVKCKDCRYFFGVFGPPKVEGAAPQLMGGQCRRNAPSSTAILIPKQVQSIEAGGQAIVPQLERVTTVPHVGIDFWCGEWTAKTA